MTVRVCMLASLLTACAGASTPAPAEEPPPSRVALPDEVVAEPSAWLAEVVAAADRTEADRALDEGRRPAEVLSFFGVAEGQRVADLFTGTGYTAELLARAVGPEGRVYAQNNAFVMDRFARGPIGQRLARPELSHVALVERELDDPLPPEARDLDAVIFILAYHDAFWMQTDRAAMNRAVFEALRPGGVYGVVDHAAAVGRGALDVQSLHRVEESIVIEEITAAGFVLEARAPNLRAPDDARDWNAAPSAAAERRGTSDRFVLRFVRP